MYNPTLRMLSCAPQQSVAFDNTMRSVCAKSTILRVWVDVPTNLTCRLDVHLNAVWRVVQMYAVLLHPEDINLLNLLQSSLSRRGKLRAQGRKLSKTL
eukprot:257351-Pyramimonas_sp.AAC.2